MGMMFGLGGMGFAFNFGGNNRGGRFNVNFIGIFIFIFVMALQFLSHYLVAGTPSPEDELYYSYNQSQYAYRTRGDRRNQSSSNNSQHSGRRQTRQSAPPTSTDYNVYESIYNLALLGLIVGILYLSNSFTRFRNARPN